MKQSALLVALALFVSSASGQGLGTGITAPTQGGTSQGAAGLGTAATAQAAAGSTTSGNTGSTTGGATGSVGLDATEAFSGIQRGAGAGATAGTGIGFSPLSAGNGGTTGGFSGGLGGFGGFGGFGNAFGNNQFGQGSTNQPIIRTRLRSAVAVPPQNTETVVRNIRRSYTSPSAMSRLGNVGVEINGRTAIVSGTVANDRDRRMSELLLQLEPGIDRVENRVVILPAR